MAQRTYISLSSENQFGLSAIAGGFTDPTVVPTTGSIGQLWIQVAETELQPTYGIYQKILTTGIDTNWEKINNPSDLDDKDAVQLASTADIPLAGALPLMVDGVSALIGYRLLLKNQAASQDNGIYDVVDAGGGNYSLTRSADADNNSNVKQGMFTWAVLGATNSRTGWLLATPNPINVGTTLLTFVQTPIPAGVSTVAFTNTLVVAKNGNDGTADGTWNKPYLTIQAAITAIATASPSNRFTILVMPGTYTENLTLKANVFLKGTVFNSSRIIGTLTLDATFTPAGDHRSGLSGVFLSGLITLDFNALSSNEGKFYISDNCRLGGGITATSFSSINQLFVNGCELFGTYTLNGMNSQFNAVMVQNSSPIILNYQAGGANAFASSGGSFYDITINAVAGVFTADLNNAIQDSATLTLNGVNAQVKTDVNSIPKKSLIVYAGGATAAQLNRTNDANSLGYAPQVPGDWSVVPNNVGQALDELAAAPGSSFTPRVEYHTLIAPEIAVKNFALAFTPLYPTAVAIDFIGGGAIEYGVAFIITAPNFVNWSALSLDGFVVAGMIMRVSYQS